MASSSPNYDLSLRREGDILGNRQHGASVLKLVNVVRDGAVIEAAHADAREYMETQVRANTLESKLYLREVDAVFSAEAQRKTHTSKKEACDEGYRRRFQGQKP